MKILYSLAIIIFSLSPICWISADSISLETAPPVVVKTEPVAGATNVDPRTTEIVVQFSKPMMDGSWSWSTWGEENFPEVTGTIHYEPDGRTCVLPVKLEPGHFYATWLNSDRFKNFKDTDARPSVPYLLTFSTAPSTPTEALSSGAYWSLLNDEQKAVIAWTDRQFHSYFDDRSFEGWSDEDLAALEARCIDALNGPRSREYYTAINTLGALGATNALPKLRELAFERVDKNNRDRWMSVRVLGIMGDRESIPDLIHLVYHGNPNTHWWSQIALVQLTGQNFGTDWAAWGEWWNASGEQPPYTPQLIRWWDGQAQTVEELKQVMAENDAKFIESIQR